MSTVDLNLIPDTIVIGNPALVVDSSEESVDAALMQAKAIAEKTNRPFTYGHFENPEKAGDPVLVAQDKYAFILVGIADSPITPESFFRLADVIALEEPDIKAIGTVRQDYVPPVSAALTAKLVGEIRLEYEKKSDQ